ncbi:MAG: hypothetical protein US49_C0006G0176 [candidate division TM6 bacterium GW2011_GWF2_37_49]|nr:MAG: hypothetical protein US49_C0006G0176 [candidate division TM6 bacterium GW2011_GWF2_37_49]
MFYSSLKKLALFPVIVFLLFQTTLADYVFYHRIGDQIEPITFEEYSKIHPIVLDYQFPMCLGNPRLLDELKPKPKLYYSEEEETFKKEMGYFDLVYDEEGFIQKRINQLKENGELPPTLEMKFIPKTVYELCFILKLAKVLQRRMAPRISEDLQLLDEPFPMADKVRCFGAIFRHESSGLCNKKSWLSLKKSWKEDEFYRRLRLENIPEAARSIGEFNSTIIEYMIKFNFDGNWTMFAESLIREIKNVQSDVKSIYDAECELEKLNRNDSVVSELFDKQERTSYSEDENLRLKAIPIGIKSQIVETMALKQIHDRFGNTYDKEIAFLMQKVDNWENFPKHSYGHYPREVGEGYYLVLAFKGFTDQTLELNTTQIKTVMWAIDLENKAHEQGFWVLYRGGTLKENKELLMKRDIAYSLSYGNSLFAGLIHDVGATAFLYIGSRGGYAISLPIVNYIMNGLSRRLFLIPPVMTFLGLYLYGEHFHARSRVFIDRAHTPSRENISGFDGLTNLPFEYIRADFNYFRTKEEFESAFHEFFRIFKDNIFEIKP